MADNEQIDKSFTKKLQEEYKLVVFRADDFKEVRSFNLSLASIYTMISIVSLLSLFTFYLLFAYTPLKKLIPGYGQIEVNQDFIKLIEDVDDITYQIESQDTYLSALRKLILTPNWEGTSQGYKGGSNNVINTSDLKSDIGEENKTQTTVEVSDVKVGDNFDIYSTLRTAKVIQPVEGVISSKFMPEVRHFGVDVLAPKDTPVKSMMDGFIFSSGWDLETGYTIGVQHAGNILSFYKHNSILLKEKGTFVRAGEALAIIGNTGTLSSGPHLHFELWHNGKPVNPEDFINFEL